MIKDKYKEDNFTKIVLECSSISEILRKLDLPTGGGSFRTIKKYILKYNIDTSHFDICKNNRESNLNNKLSLKDILINPSTFNTNHLKKRLYKEGLKDKKCEICGQDENWRGKKFSLILDHIDGNHLNHTLENLRIVCPNCNATLDTHCGKHIKREKKKYYCSCGKEISKSAKKCKGCTAKSFRKVDRPDKETLLEEVKNLGYCAVGRKYGVTDNSIKKWISM